LAYLGFTVKLLSDTVYAGTWNDGVFKSINACTSWIQLNNGLTNKRVPALAIDPTDSDRVFAGTDGGGVFKSLDGDHTLMGDVRSERS
jgi:hypothetical protein